MKGLNAGIPLAVLAATAHAQGGIYRGPHGDDTGNSANVGIDNTASNVAHQKWSDDHSVKGNFNVHPPWWWKRGDINEGPTGDDTGNSAGVGINNEAESETKQDIKDNHSFKGNYNVHPPWWWKRGDINEGPTGDDTGNSAGVGINNEAESETKQDVKDNHSVKENANVWPGWPYWYPGAPYPYPGGNRPARGYHTGMKEARDAPGTINEAAAGDDVGNVANIPIKNSASNDFSGKYQDNHAVKINYDWPFEKRAFTPSDNEGSSDDEDGTTEKFNQNHSVEVNDGKVTFPGQDSHGVQQAVEDACKAYQVTHTVTMTRTHTAMATETATPVEQADPSMHAAQTPASQAVENQYPSQAIENPNIHSGMASYAPIATPVAHGSQAAPIATPVAYGSQAAPEPTPVAHGSQAVAESTPGAYHQPAASQITVGQASAYTVIPVYVPSGASHGSVVIQASSTPASSSAFRTHALPTGLSPEQNPGSSSSASPSSSHGPLAFTGGASQLVPSAGVFTALAGACALLAFAL